MQASDIIQRAAPLLNDADNVRWEEPELLRYIADAQQQIVDVKPSSNSVTQNITLTAQSTLQNKPATAKQMIRLVRNMGSGGATPGRAIIMTSRESMDAMDVNWHSETGDQVERWIYDPDADRDVFWVYPALSQRAMVEAVYSKNPASTIASPSTALDLGPQYLNPILDWVLYRCFSKDADYGGNLQRAQTHLEAFATNLGVKIQRIMRTNPNFTRRDVAAQR